ncbi:hypothetical protein AAH114_19200, partial [Phocaeicola vulgatus]
LHYSWGNPLNCLYTIFKVVKILTLIIQICCLIKLRFSNGDIANMLAISPTSVSKRKLRLKERIVQEIGSLGENQSLDLWLMEY